MNLLSIIGARPQFIKAAPVSRVLRQAAREVLLHTGQHYDYGMSDIFFEELHIPQPDYNLGVGSGPHGRQTGQMLIAIEEVLLQERPDCVLVYGDTNSTLAGALAAVKLHIPVAHVEAGLRSFNRAMPEGINRIVTDALSDFLFTTSRDADENLLREGIAAEKIFFVGNVMIDTLMKHRARSQQLGTPAHFRLEAGHYALLTLHRLPNVDDPTALTGSLAAPTAIQRDLPVRRHPRWAFPV